MDRRKFLTTASVLAASQLLAKTDKPQRFDVGFGPATDGTLDSYWIRMKALSDLGFHYIEVDNGVVKIAEAYANKPAEFRDRMAQLNLHLAGLNQGYRFTDNAAAAAIKEKNLLVGKFLQDVGGSYIGWEGALAPGNFGEQIEDEADLRRIAALANEEGKRLKEEFGIRFSYHTNSTFGFRRLMDLTNPAYLGITTDLGWLTARGNADVLEVLRAYRSRLAAVHFKDYDPNHEWTDRNTRGKGGMVVAGQGIVNFPAVVDFLKESAFEGFVHGEHIGIGTYDVARSPRELEVYPKYKEYFVSTLGLKL